MEKILEILNAVKPGVDFSQSTNLWEEGVIDSFDIICIVSQLKETFDIEIGVKDLVEENFSSVSAINDFVQRLLE